MLGFYIGGLLAHILSSFLYRLLEALYILWIVHTLHICSPCLQFSMVSFVQTFKNSLYIWLGLSTWNLLLDVNEGVFFYVCKS